MAEKTILGHILAENTFFSHSLRVNGCAVIILDAQLSMLELQSLSNPTFKDDGTKTQPIPHARSDAQE
jgi:hypothetical protein